VILFSRSAPPVRSALTALVALFCVFSVLFAIQFRLDLIPKVDRLTPAELFSDKFTLLRVRRLKVVAQNADDLITAGRPKDALEVLQTVGPRPDRDVLEQFARAYRALGQQTDAINAESQLRQLMASRLY